MTCEAGGAGGGGGGRGAYGPEIHIKHRQLRFYTLRRMALAFVLIKQMLKLENRSKDACDFGRDLWIASLPATCSKKKKEASLPQAP